MLDDLRIDTSRYRDQDLLPSGNLLHGYGKSPFLMGKSTISMAMFNSYVKLPEGTLWPFVT